MGVYSSEGGGIVFTAASTDWAHGLAGPDGNLDGEADQVAVQVTRNVLKRLGDQVGSERGRL